MSLVAVVVVTVIAVNRPFLTSAGQNGFVLSWFVESLSTGRSWYLRRLPDFIRNDLLVVLLCFVLWSCCRQTAIEICCDDKPDFGRNDILFVCFVLFVLFCGSIAKRSKAVVVNKAVREWRWEWTRLWREWGFGFVFSNEDGRRRQAAH